MNSLTAALKPTDAALAPRRHATIYIKETKYEFLKLVRLPGFLIPTLLFPVMFYVVFGLVMDPQGPVRMATYLLATFGTFNVMGTALFGFGVSVAVERGQGWLEVKRASPMPPLAYFTAKLAVAMLFCFIPILMLLALGVTLGGVTISSSTAVALASVLVLGSLPFCAMGLAVGYLTGPNSAAPTVNLIYFPMAFCSGLWVPIDFLPGWFRTIAHVLPSYHLSELALATLGLGHGGPRWLHFAFLLAVTVVALAAARFGFKRDEGKLYG